MKTVKRTSGNFGGHEHRKWWCEECGYEKVDADIRTWDVISREDVPEWYREELEEVVRDR